MKKIRQTLNVVMMFANMSEEVNMADVTSVISCRVNSL